MRKLGIILVISFSLKIGLIYSIARFLHSFEDQDINTPALVTKDSADTTTGAAPKKHRTTFFD